MKVGLNQRVREDREIEVEEREIGQRAKNTGE